MPEKYLHQGTKIAIIGRIQTGSYTNREGQKIYTTDVVVEEQEFAESKTNTDTGSYRTSVQSGKENRQAVPSVGSDEFMQIPDGIDDELPFH